MLLSIIVVGSEWQRRVKRCVEGLMSVGEGEGPEATRVADDVAEFFSTTTDKASFQRALVDYGMKARHADLIYEYLVECAGPRGLDEGFADRAEDYYQREFGEHYRTRKVFDLISGEDVAIGETIDEDSDNIVIQVDRHMFATSRRQVANLNPIYECEQIDSMRQINYDIKYISLSKLGCPCEGVANYDAVQTVIADSHFQLFKFRGAGRRTKTLVSHEIARQGESMVSGFHCQQGTQKPYYQLYVPAMHV